MDNALPENETIGENAGGEDTDMIFALAHAPDLAPGRAGLVFSGRNSGLYRSADGGSSWEFALADVGLSEPVPVLALAISPVFEREPRIIAGLPGGVFVSSDGGSTWKAVLLPNPPPTVTALAISPSFEQDETVFAGTMEDGVFISRAGGESWTAWNFGLLDLKVLCLAVSPDYASDETLFAGTETGVFRSTNGGRAWREIELPFGYDAVLSLAFSPSYSTDRTLYAGTEGNGLWVSTDEGERWARLGEELIDEPINGLLTRENAILAVTSSALWYSADGGATWKDRLPSEYEGHEVSTVLAPQGFQPGAEILAGFNDGEVEVVRLV